MREIWKTKRETSFQPGNPFQPCSEEGRAFTFHLFLQLQKGCPKAPAASHACTNTLPRPQFFCFGRRTVNWEATHAIPVHYFPAVLRCIRTRQVSGRVNLVLLLWRRLSLGFTSQPPRSCSAGSLPRAGASCPLGWPAVPSGGDSRAVLWRGWRHRAGQGGRWAKRPSQLSCLAHGTANLFF